MSFSCLCGRVQPLTDHEVLIGIEYAVLQIDQIKERLCFLVKDFFVSRFKGRGEILIILRGAVGDGLTKQIGQIIQIAFVVLEQLIVFHQVFHYFFKAFCVI